MKSTFRSFLKSTSGNIAIMFSLVALPLFVGIGVAVDLVRVNNANGLLQTAADAAALAGAAGRKSALSEAAADKTAKDFLTANGADSILKSVSIQDMGYNKTTRIYHVKIKGTVSTTFMAMVGISTMDAVGYSEVAMGGGGLELALVLDTTGSMNAEGRLDGLKVAAKDLVDKVLKDKDPDAYVKVGMVPFANYVNVGVANRNKFWVDVPATTKTWSCWDTYPHATSYNCHDVANGPVDGVPQVGTHQECDYNYGAAVKQCGWDDPQWLGIVGSRNNGLDTKIVGNGAPYPGLINVWGPQAITELTTNANTLDSNIDALTADAETYIPEGLVWGWELLDAAEPFLGAKTTEEMAATKGTKALVLMTDGDNTKSADYPYNWGSDSADADAKTSELCSNIKKAGISVYTVAFKVEKASSQKMLKDCASAPSQAFDASNNAALLAAFNEIANSLAQIRLTK